MRISTSKNAVSPDRACRAAVFVLGIVCGVAPAQPPVAGDARLDARYPPMQERTGLSAVAWDSARSRLVRFGGVAKPCQFPETAEFDGSNWVGVATAHVPPVLTGHRMVYDAARGVTVLFGGTPDYDGTWTYDGVDWTERMPVTRPPARTGHAMVYDSARSRVVLFGGVNATTNALSDTWEWNGTNWIAGATGPTGRKDAAAAFDSGRGVAVLVNGSSWLPFTIEGWGTFWAWRPITNMWEYTGAAWNQITPSKIPGASGPMGYDSASGRLVYFGSLGGGSHEAWTFDGTTWTSNTVSGGPTRETLDLVSTPAGRLFCFDSGTSLDDANQPTVWTWTNMAWECRTPFYGASTVALNWADVDGDGRKDLLISTSLIINRTTGASASGLAVLRNEGGSLSGLPYWTRSGAFGATAFGDLDGDGGSDLAAAGGSVQVYRATSGTLSATPSWASSGSVACAGLAWADVDRDGDADLTALCTDSSGVVVQIYTNSGGVLAGSALEWRIPNDAGGAKPLANAQVAPLLQWADFDGDGTNEVAASVYYAASGYVVFLGRLAGGVVTEVHRKSGLESPIGAGDIDGDGRADLVAVSNMLPVVWLSSNGVPAVLAGTGDTEDATWTITSMQLADQDGDGDPELLVSRYDGGTARGGHAIYRNDAGRLTTVPVWRSFEPIGQVAGSGTAAALVDINNDGAMDVAATQGMFLLGAVARDAVGPRAAVQLWGEAGAPGTSGITLHWQPGAGDLPARYRIYRGANVSGSPLIGEAPGTATSFVVPVQAVGFDAYIIEAVDAAGNVSRIVASETIGGLPDTLAKGDGMPDTSVSGTTLVGDLDGDGHPDLFAQRNNGSNNSYGPTPFYVWSVWLWQGTTFTQTWSHAWGPAAPPAPVALQDLDDDGRADLIARGSGPAILTYRSLGDRIDTNVWASLSLPADNTAGRYALGDSNADGWIDLAVNGVGTTRTAAVYLGGGSGAFQSSPVWTCPGSNVEAMAFGRLDAGLAADLAVAEDIGNGGSTTRARISVFAGEGGGPAASPVWSYSEAANADPAGFSWADYDGDGNADLTFFSSFAAYAYRSDLGVLPGAVSNAATITFFSPASNEPGHGLFAWGRADANGIMDLIGAHSILPDAAAAPSGSVVNAGSWQGVRYNVNKFIADPWTGTQSRFTSIEKVADFDGDGLTDLMSGYANLLFLGPIPTTNALAALVPTNLVVTPAGPVRLSGSGAVQGFSVIAQFPDGSSRDVSTETSISYSPPKGGAQVCRIEGTNIVAVADGTISLTLQWHAVYKTFTVTVTSIRPEPVGLVLSPGAATLTRQGQPLTFTASALMDNGTIEDVTAATSFSAAPASVAAMTGATAIARQNGVASVVAFHGPRAATGTLTVALSASMTNLAVFPPTAVLPVGGRGGFEIRAQYSDGTVEPVTFHAALASSEPAIAALNGAGVVGLSPGVSRLAASYEGRSGEGYVAVYGPQDDPLFEIFQSPRFPADPRLRWFCLPQSGVTAPFAIQISTNPADAESWADVDTGIPRQAGGFHERSVPPPTNGAAHFIRIRTLSEP